MRIIRVFVFIVAVAATGMAMSGSEAADTANSVHTGFGGLPRLMAYCDANVPFIEYERAISGSRFTVLARVGGVDYRFDNGVYRETGDPKGIDIGARYYPGGGREGLFVTGTVGYWTGDWTFTDYKNTPLALHGKASSDSVRFNLDAGARFPIGTSPFAIMPALNVGVFKPSTECIYTAPAPLAGTPCDRETEVRGYLFLAVMAGVAF